ncbi:arginine--tRNA ligase [Thermonema rossianum]|uniref:arginine--tRNA ligase n=1 Tax=Thermonema rossianum TaxID=55505 RepID=UPI00056EE8DB|nr:arginine--tRNA ligase [Thermonema rossianum]
MNVQAQLENAISTAIRELFDTETAAVSLQPTRKEFKGTYTFVTFPLTKTLRRKPEEIAQAIGEWLQSNSPLVRAFNVVKGFLNIELSNEVFVHALADYSRWLEAFPNNTRHSKQEKVVVEYSSPNTNKPLHLGHLRNNFLGYSMATILEANGYDVHKTQIINDRGIHICKSMLAYQRFGKGETPESSGIKGDHLVGHYYVVFERHYREQVKALMEQGMSKEEAEKEAPLMKEAQEMLRQWEAGNPEVRALWEKMNRWVLDGFDETYRKIGVSFDSVYYESDTYLLGKDIVEEGLQKGIFFKKEDGSVWVDLSDEGLDQKLLLRGDGTSVYITQDLGTAEKRYQEHHMQRMIYVVGNEQDYHFKVLFAILKRLGRPYADGLFHLSYGMVDLPSGKMKSREGTVVDADDLVAEVIDIARQITEEKLKNSDMLDSFTPDELNKLYEIIGLGALKYFLVRVDPKKRMLFNPQESIDFEGDAAPFIQYTHARICSVLRKAGESQIKAAFPENHALSEQEEQLVFTLTQFPEKLDEAARTYAPSVLAQYIYELTRLYNSFYAHHSILKAETSEAASFRLAISQATAQTIRKGMQLLGIEVPERM